MDSLKVSRRGLLLAGAGYALADAPVSANQIIDRIKQHDGVPWRTPTVDRIVAGDGETAVNGIAVTMMATLDVVERAAAAGKNMVITHEPTFYLHQDTTDTIAGDPTVLFKKNLIRKNNMVVFRFHDHWHAHRPDGIAFGMARELRWEKNADSQDFKAFTFPASSLASFAKGIQENLHIRAMRVVGDPKLTVRRVAVSWGAGGRDSVIALFRKPEVDAVVIGEGREWEIVEYAQDAITAGDKKALLVLGHVVSEQSGMKYCTEWLKTFIADVPVEFIPAAEPFWIPG